MSKRVLPFGPEPYSRLEPLVEELLSRGSALARDGQGDSHFGPSPEGYIAVLTDPLDWEHLTAAFDLPATVRHDAVRDVVDDEHWTPSTARGARRRSRLTTGDRGLEQPASGPVAPGNDLAARFVPLPAA